MAAALELIEDQGLARLTTKEVARRAGVSEASVFYHFGDKTGLPRAVVLAGLAPLEDLELLQLAGDDEKPLAGAFGEVMLALAAFFERALPITEAVQGDAELRGGEPLRRDRPAFPQPPGSKW